MTLKLHGLSEYQAFCEKMKFIDFKGIAHTLSLEHKWTNLRIERGIDRYKKLLFVLHRYPNQSIVPDQETDQVIHTHIATGNQYVQDCQRLFNASLEHASGFGTRQAAERLSWLQTFDRVQLLMERCFPLTRCYYHSQQQSYNPLTVFSA